MNTQINAYLTFKNNCEEAMTFYQECLGGELTLNRIKGSAMESQFPPEQRDLIMHANLVKDRLSLMGSDMFCTGETANLEHGNAMALSLHCSSEEEIKTFFSKLSAGGQITDPLKDQFWGALFGMLTDKFGVKWLLNFEKNQA